MEKKYQLTNETLTLIYWEKELHRIQALKDFGDVKAGDLGGWVESERNLSQYGSYWVYDDGKVMDSAFVEHDVIVSGLAVVKGEAVVQGSAIVQGSAVVRDSAVVNGSAVVKGQAVVRDSAVVRGSALVQDLVVVKGSAVVQQDAVVSGTSIISENAIIKSNAIIIDTIVDGKAVIGKNGYITNRDCYCAIENIGSKHDTVTFYLDKERNIWVNTGCFNDTLEAFEQAVISTHKGNEFERKYMAAIQFAKTMLNNGY